MPASSSSALPRYGYMVFVLGALACLGPFTIDAYLPAFNEIGAAFDRSQIEVQGTLGFYLVAYTITSLFHGTLSDSFGRKRVILGALALYTLGAVVAAMAPSFEWLIAGRVLQGLSAGAGMIIGQAIVNDCYVGATAQRTLSYIIMVFSISPAIAPVVGGFMAVAYGWRSIFVLMAALAVASFALCAWGLPETLPAHKRQPLSPRAFLGSITTVLSDKLFCAFSVAFGVLFGGLAFLVGGAHDFVTHVLRLPETAFGYLFIPLVAGMLAGSTLAVRLAKKRTPGQLIALGYGVMAVSCISNLAYSASTTNPVVPWAVIPLALYSCGLCLALPSMTLTVLRRMPGLGGTAASLLGFIQGGFFAGVAGWGVALIYGSAVKLAVALTLAMAVSGVSWWLLAKVSAGEESAAGTTPSIK